MTNIKPDIMGTCKGCGRAIAFHHATRQTFHEEPVCEAYMRLVAETGAKQGAKYEENPLTGKLEPQAKA